MDIQSGVRALDILKWVGLAFAAGFIGYFGRYLSMALIERAKKRKKSADRIISTSPEKTTNGSLDNTYDSKTAKLEKKKYKDQIKKAKKESTN